MTKYRTIYVTQPAHDYSLLAKYCKQVKFMMTGKEDNLQRALEVCLDSLKDFQPDKDAIVVVGKVNGAFLAGIAMQKLFPSGITFDMGVYIDVGASSSDTLKDYRWEQVYV